MSKKLVIVLVLLGVIGIGSFVGSSVLKASDHSFNLFKSVSLLGQGVILNGSATFKFLDAQGATDSQFDYLPSLSGNNGMVHVIKRTGTPTELNYVGIVVPASGEAIDGNVDTGFIIDESHSSVILVADESANTWWSVSFD